MPYHIIKKVKLQSKGSSNNPPSFLIELEDNATWGLFKLYRKPCPIIHGEAVRLLNFDGTTNSIFRDQERDNYSITCTSECVLKIKF